MYENRKINKIFLVSTGLTSIQFSKYKFLIENYSQVSDT